MRSIASFASVSDFRPADIDYALITPRIIAIACPENPSILCRFLKSEHRGRSCRLYILCPHIDGTIYDEAGEMSIISYPIDEFNPCALRVMETFCNDVDEFLNDDKNHVIAAVCSTGRGRTGLMISAYLMYSGLCPSAELARRHFDTARSRSAISTPSQIRYLYYFETLLRSSHLTTYTYRISHIRMHTVPNFDSAITGGGCDPYVVIKTFAQISRTKWKQKLVFNQLKENKPIRKYNASDTEIDIDLREYCIDVRNDVNITLFDKDDGASEKMCRVWFHTAFIDDNYLVFEKEFVDKAVFDRRHRSFHKDFRIEIFLHRIVSEADSMEETMQANEDDVERDILLSYTSSGDVRDVGNNEDVGMDEGDYCEDGLSNCSDVSAASDCSDISGDVNEAYMYGRSADNDAVTRMLLLD